MLRLAYWVGLGGVACSLGLALSASSTTPLASGIAPYVALFGSSFVSFASAIVAHPARRRTGSTFHLRARALFVASPWVLALTASVLLALLLSVIALPRGDHFTADAASLAGRVDRQVALCLFFAAVHAVALCAADSGLRWALRAKSVGPSSWLGVPTPLLGRAAPGAPLTHRTAKVGWLVIGLEFAGSVAAVALTGSRLPEAPSRLHLLALALLAVPFWHLFLKSCGHVTFILDGASLVTQHFPFSVRNRRIPLAEIRGIQVNAERDDQGSVTHYSLLLVRDHATTDRLLDDLPSAEHARALAQQIDGLVRIGSAGTH